MPPVRAIIQRAANTTRDATTQMQMIRRILEDIYGGTWGVLIIKNPNLISQEVHWTIPDHVNTDGSPAFCLVVVNRWQFNVFKTGPQDRVDRVTVEDIVNKIRQSDEEVKPRPRRYTVREFDRKLAWAIEQDKLRRRRHTFNNRTRRKLIKFID
ncbi:hypothetical protein WR25_06842 [Diploscapter pachys]|uniref:Uncharacterized protein n=1 Tax=Diploscapter pachys TaxID=2018661 RepID=A0A2A2JHG5_9BILA|nr:hypothetical protein WR25_06842 [Diploscapter pachys]